jgi:phage terminase Nu1 subunit (DNA packaging protein)
MTSSKISPPMPGRASHRWKGGIRLHPAFGHIRVAAFGTNVLKKYIANRKAEEAANATINREMTILKRAFNTAQSPFGDASASLSAA